MTQLRDTLVEAHPTFGAMGYAPGAVSVTPFDVETLGEAGALSSTVLQSAVSDFYMTNPVARASEVMAECSAVVEAQDPAYGEAAE